MKSNTVRKENRKLGEEHPEHRAENEEIAASCFPIYGINSTSPFFYVSP
jgi:hypothetical protein